MSVEDMLQDRQGFIWVATQDGLNRYDGYQFKVYRNRFDDPYSLSDNRVLDIHEDANGELWVATAAGLNRFDRELAKFSNMNLTKRENEVIEQLLSRKSNNDIVQELGISQNTLRTHLKSIYRKIGKESEEKLKSLRKI